LCAVAKACVVQERAHRRVDGGHRGRPILEGQPGAQSAIRRALGDEPELAGATRGLDT
jgi:hypothetical protein